MRDYILLERRRYRYSHCIDNVLTFYFITFSSEQNAIQEYVVGQIQEQVNTLHSAADS